ncbi:S8 family serine peptidase [Streptomyces sp. VRA16 Mangrove soil]|nr:S8 family serine peptidase [Streptomyces sp. VRA16 Mangrove soil]
MPPRGRTAGDSTLGSPGTADSALTVGAVDSYDTLANFSSRGPRLGDMAIKPDVTAPGVGIVAARAAGTTIDGAVNVGAYYTTLSGTSMATPHVADAAAILAQRHPEWNGQQIKSALTAHAAASKDSTVYQLGGRPHRHTGGSGRHAPGLRHHRLRRRTLAERHAPHPDPHPHLSQQRHERRAHHPGHVRGGCRRRPHAVRGHPGRRPADRPRRRHRRGHGHARPERPDARPVRRLSHGERRGRFLRPHLGRLSHRAHPARRDTQDHRPVRQRPADGHHDRARPGTATTARPWSPTRPSSPPSPWTESPPAAPRSSRTRPPGR